MHYAQIKRSDVANGPGVRVSLFVSGCRNRCRDCFNEVAWDFAYGAPYTEETQQTLLSALKPVHISGLTILGGEPFEPENQPTLLKLTTAVRAAYPQKSIWCFTGFTFDELVSGSPDCRACGVATLPLLKTLDVLVDGRFEADKKDLMLQFRGSSNQRVIDVPKTLASGAVTVWDQLKY